mmetsp:Transcript_5998/g.6889  ORF Transcript_5998/g.6889 Transcript_5998/m.6889 type:complete len:550 (-) Transcript_5998:181-1830(-)
MNFKFTALFVTAILTADAAKEYSFENDGSTTRGLRVSSDSSSRHNERGLKKSGSKKGTSGLKKESKKGFKKDGMNLGKKSKKASQDIEPVERQLTVSPAYMWQSSAWKQRFLVGESDLAIDVFEETLDKTSEICGADYGYSATVFDHDGNQVFQKSVGTLYNDGYSTIMGNPGTPTEGWDGDTVFPLYSNSKVMAAIVFITSVVETGLGFLDEPLSNTFPEYKDTRVGKITPRMCLSHRTGLKQYYRETVPGEELYYICLRDGSKDYEGCVKEYLLKDEYLTMEPGEILSMEMLANPPNGVYIQYNNTPFDILVLIILKKTSLKNMGEVLRKYVTDPLGMNKTTYDCPSVLSTSEKPMMAFGLCSTSYEMAKIPQMFVRNGKKADGSVLLSENNVREIFQDNHNGGNPLPNAFAGVAASCNKVEHDYDPYDNTGPFVGYGLGTMMPVGVKGEWKIHAASVGGMWVVAPNRFAVYFGHYNAKGYNRELDILNKFERASSFKVRHDGYIVVNETTGALESAPGPFEEITPCVHGMFIDNNEVYDSAVSVTC